MRTTVLLILLGAVFVNFSVAGTSVSAAVPASAQANMESTKEGKLDLAVKNNNIVISLPEKSFNALKKWNKDFTVFNQSDYSPSIQGLFEDEKNNKSYPMTFIADVNGDNKEDIVLFGEDKKKQYVVALVQDKNEWTVVVVKELEEKNLKKTEIPSLEEKKKTKAELGIPYYVAKAQGDIGEALQKSSHSTAIQFEHYLGQAEVYEIKNNKAVLYKGQPEKTEK